VISTLKGSKHPEQLVILGAHLDDRDADRVSPTNRAPGANDDGSGSAALLAMAAAIHGRGTRFEKTLVFEVGSRTSLCVLFSPRFISPHFITPWAADPPSPHPPLSLAACLSL
jgi:Zn-dependent M28 family amino/carboxypeptidase